MALDPLPISQAHTVIIIKSSSHILNPNRHHHWQRIRKNNTIPHQQNRQYPSTISTINRPSSLPHNNLLNPHSFPPNSHRLPPNQQISSQQLPNHSGSPPHCIPQFDHRPPYYGSPPSFPSTACTIEAHCHPFRKMNDPTPWKSIAYSVRTILIRPSSTSRGDTAVYLRGPC